MEIFTFLYFLDYSLALSPVQCNGVGGLTLKILLG